MWGFLPAFLPEWPNLTPPADRMFAGAHASRSPGFTLSESAHLSTDPSTPTALVSLPVVDTIGIPDADDVPKAATGEEEKEDGLLLIA